MKLEVKVVPGSREFGLEETPDGWKVRVKARAEKNRANLELLRGLEKVTGCRTRLLRGGTARRKVIEIEGKEGEVLQRLRKEARKEGA